MDDRCSQMSRRTHHYQPLPHPWNQRDPRCSLNRGIAAMTDKASSTVTAISLRIQLFRNGTSCAGTTKDTKDTK